MRRRSKKVEKKNENDWKNEDFVLRAVVIAESFNQRFLPITYEKPRTLLNFFNAKIIDYTLKWLVDSGVAEVLVVVCSHAEIIKDHISASELLKQHPTLSVSITTVANEICDSVGDVMRELEQNYKHVVSQDFLLLTGFMISTVNLNNLITQHKEDKKIHKNTIMTMIFKDHNLLHKNSEFDTTYFTLTDRAEHRLVYIKNFCNLHEGIPYSYLQFNRKLTAGCNLHPSGVYICSPIVPQLFVDNFDFQGIHCLINNVLNREQILFNYNIHYVTLKNDVYLSNINTLNSYYSTLMDLINRWAYPITLESLGYRLHTNLHYIFDVPLLITGCLNTSRTHNDPVKMVIDSGTVVGSNSTIRHSYVGSNCLIGNDVTILDSVIWDGVTIEDGSIIKNSFIADNVVIGRNVEIEEGSIISYGVITRCSVPDHACVAKHTYLMLKNESRKDLADSDFSPCSTTKVLLLPDHFKLHYMWGTCKRPFNFICREYFTNQPLVDDGNSVDFDNDFHDDQTKFQSEVHDSILFGVRDSLPNDAIVLEINASKHAYNICIDDMASYIIPTSLNIILNGNLHEHLKSDDTTNSIPSLSNQPNSDEDLLFNYKKILPPVIEMLGIYTTEAKQQRSLLGLIENFFFQCAASVEKAHFIKFYLKFVHDLYERDILDDSNILHWDQSTRETLSNTIDNEKAEKQIQFRNQNLGKFISWLEEASEESDDEDDE